MFVNHCRTLVGVSILVLLAAAPVAGQAPQARIKIDTDRQIGEVNPLLFGNFAEHLGRAIYGGIYEEGSPLSDADGYRKDTMQAVKNLDVTILRWPGGNFVSGYNWKDGIGPKDQRPVRPDYAWGDVETNRFGTDEFLTYAERIGTVPYICINAGLGSVDDARHWVEYTAVQIRRDQPQGLSALFEKTCGDWRVAG
jgi:alpha-N-arabinofuranosidase